MESLMCTEEVSCEFISPYPPPRQGNFDAHCNSISMFVQYTFVQNSCSAINQRSTFHRYGCFFSTMRRKMCPCYPMCNSFFARFGFGQQVLSTYRWIFPRVCICPQSRRKLMIMPNLILESLLQLKLIISWTTTASINGWYLRDRKPSV